MMGEAAMETNVASSVNNLGQAVTVVTFSDGSVAEVVTYVHENELQVTIDRSRTHGTTVAVDDNDVYIAR
ncbi:hypothetical protein AN480_28130 (plasmid) [Mycobacterium intracellulare subsp. chimaera]|nr:hypothetical protein AN480_28130 [Mycobacterium intracellulare subsp. chimaera]